MTDVNLAYPLEDGMKIYIPTKQESQNKTEQVETISKEIMVSSSQTLNNEAKEQSKTNTNTKVNINTATQTQLETLAGIGPSTASKILAYRKENGKFNTIEDIKKVSGIGNAKFEKIKENITVK